VVKAWWEKVLQETGITSINAGISELGQVGSDYRVIGGFLEETIFL